MKTDIQSGHKAAIWEDRTVRTEEIVVDNHFRARQGDLYSAHVRVLASALTGGARLDPLSVWQDPSRTDGAFVLLDGAYRLAAYKAVNKRGEAVNARVALCDRRTALLIAAAANSKDKLSLHYSEKADMAWRLVREEEARYSKAEVARSTTISTRTVANMRSRWREMRATEREATGRWARDRLDMPNDWTPKGQLEGAVRQAEVKAMARRILEAVGRAARYDEYLVAEALEAAFGYRYRNMADYSFGDVDEWSDIVVPRMAVSMIADEDENTDF